MRRAGFARRGCRARAFLGLHRWIRFGLVATDSTYPLYLRRWPFFRAAWLPGRLLLVPYLAVPVPRSVCLLTAHLFAAPADGPY